jgi:hypothetical protein
LKNLHPACRVISWVEVQKRTDAREHVRFRDRLPRFYEFGRNKMEILKIMTNQ